jgi:hypothetical protein
MVLYISHWVTFVNTSLEKYVQQKINQGNLFFYLIIYIIFFILVLYFIIILLIRRTADVTLEMAYIVRHNLDYAIWFFLCVSLYLF